MRIAMVLDSEFPPDPRVENEALTLIQNGHEVAILCIDYSHTQPAQEMYQGISVTRLSLSNFVFKLSALAYSIPLYHSTLEKHIRKFLSNFEPDALHIHDIQSARAVFNASGGIPIVLDLHENRPEIMKYYAHVQRLPGKLLIRPDHWKKYESKYIEKAEKVIVVTEDAANHYSTTLGVDRSKFVVVPNSVRADYLSSPIESEIVERYKHNFVLLYLGDTGLRRGLRTVIEAVPDLVKSIPEIKVVVVGSNTTDPILREQARNLGVEKAIDFEGWQGSTLFPSYLKASHVGLSPLHKNIHHDTTYANKLFQYMAFGLPLIVSNCDAQEKLVVKHGAGLVFKEKDSKSLAEAVNVLYQSKELLTEYGSNGRRAMTEELVWEKSSAGLVKLYKDLKSSEKV